MGSLFGKPKKSRVTEHDKAVLQLKQQRDKLKQYQKRIELALENDRLLAKKCLQSGRKDRARMLLRKKKYQEKLLENTDQQLENLEKLASDIEFSQIEQQVLDGLKTGNAALKKVHEILTIEEVEKVLDETKEGVDKQQEIDALLSGVLTEDDEDAVLAELNELIGIDETPKIDENLEDALPDVPTDEPIAVPEKKQKTKHKEAEKVALEA